MTPEGGVSGANRQRGTTEKEARLMYRSATFADLPGVTPPGRSARPRQLSYAHEGRR